MRESESPTQDYAIHPARATWAPCEANPFEFLQHMSLVMCADRTFNRLMKNPVIEASDSP